MNNFFESEIVQDELEDINRMQHEVYSAMGSLNSLSKEEKRDHIDQLTELLEKQRVMYTRLSLSDDPQAVKMKEQLQKSVQLMGFPAGTDIQVLFDGMKQTISNLRQHVD